MERAGKHLARIVGASKAPRAGKGRSASKAPVLVLCGKGNNGGDGLVAARHLLDAGREVHVVLAESDSHLHGAARAAWAALPKACFVAWRSLKPHHWGVVVDCLLGSGVRGMPRAPYAAMIGRINRHRGPIIACDVPSGFGSSLAVRPTRTVTFHARKEGMTPANCGRIDVVDIGIPARAGRECGIGDLAVGFPRPGMESHKGDNGVVLVVAGGPFAGAPHYAGMGAVRSGADLVLLWTPEAAARVVSAWGPDLLVHASNPGETLSLAGAQNAARHLKRSGCLLVGPGLGSADETREAVAWLLGQAAARGVPCVVDADGLDALTPELLPPHKDIVLTPHAAEFRDLTGREATPAHVAAYAKRAGATVLCKGATDIIASPQRRKLNTRGHPTMTVGGTGDVLAGCVAALMAKGAQPFDAACAAAYLVGCAGEVAYELRSWGATATDVHEAIPAVLRRLDEL